MTRNMSESRSVSRRDLLQAAGGGALAGVLAGCAAETGELTASVDAASLRKQPKENDLRRPEPIVNYHCVVGENPLWDDKRQAVYWTDIPRGRLFRHDVCTGRHAQIYSGEPVGGFTLQKDGSLLLFQVNKFSLLRPDGSAEELVAGIDDDMVRFNDVIADPQGRVYAGTIGKNNKVGGVYLVETDGTVANLFKGTGCSNGMAFSPDRKHLYWTCTSTRRIFRFDRNPATGNLTGQDELIRIGKEEGVPDGLTVDARGDIWSARWDGSAIWRYTPSGRPIERIVFPVAKVSSLVFGGPDLDELYVTTAGGSEGANTADGTLYRVKVGVRGLPEFRSNLRLR